MRHRRIDIPLTSPVSSLCWSGESLIDWAGGNRVFDIPSGERRREFGIKWAYRFNAAIQSRSGRYVVIYERFGTKALLLNGEELVRELNRSYYFADEYEYPIMFLDHPDGRELIAHCPDHYNRVEIEEAASGKRLTECPGRNPADCFLSRFAASADNKWLVSAGWVWHPFETLSVWSVADALADPRTLDASWPQRSVSMEINSAVFIDCDRLLLSENPARDCRKGDVIVRPGKLGLLDLRLGALEPLAKLEQTVGAMLWLGDDRVVGFYETPRVINVRTGAVECGWPDLFTGKLIGCISGDVGPLPPLAIDQARRRFAVASDNRITVIEFL